MVAKNRRNFRWTWSCWQVGAPSEVGLLFMLQVFRSRRAAAATVRSSPRKGHHSSTLTTRVFSVYIDRYAQQYTGVGAAADEWRSIILMLTDIYIGLHTQPYTYPYCSWYRNYRVQFSTAQYKLQLHWVGGEDHGWC